MFLSGVMAAAAAMFERLLASVVGIKAEKA